MNLVMTARYKKKKDVEKGKMNGFFSPKRNKNAWRNRMMKNQVDCHKKLKKESKN